MYGARRAILLAALILLLTAGTACRKTTSEAGAQPGTTDVEAVDEPASEGGGAPAATEDGAAVAPTPDWAGPAADYCAGLGYETATAESAAGLDAICRFPDGSQCGQLEFLTGQCGQKQSYCLQNGGKQLEVHADVAICLFRGGSSCNEYAFFTGDCWPGQNVPLETAPAAGH